MPRFCTVILVIGLTAASSGRAGVVLHDVQEGVVAVSDHLDQTALRALDSNGQVWYVSRAGWVRDPYLDVPMPVANIRTWDRDILITMDNELWCFMGTPERWENLGTWPSSQVGQTMEAPPSVLKAFPNPSDRSFAIARPEGARGPANLQVTDVSGRVLRQIRDAGSVGTDGTVTWDGTDALGRPVGTGAYFLRLRVGEEEVTRRVVVVK